MHQENEAEEMEAPLPPPPNASSKLAKPLSVVDAAVGRTEAAAAAVEEEVGAAEGGGGGLANGSPEAKSAKKPPPSVEAVFREIYMQFIERK